MTGTDSSVQNAVGILIGLQGVIIALLGLLTRAIFQYKKVLWEHDLMWNDYAIKHGLMVRQLSTRPPQTQATNV